AKRTRWRLRALNRRILPPRPIAAANQYRQTRIFYESRGPERKLTNKENRTAIRLDAARMPAALAKAWVGVGRSVGDLGRNKTDCICNPLASHRRNRPS